jgi:molecular chaperone GrpE
LAVILLISGISNRKLYMMIKKKTSETEHYERKSHAEHIGNKDDNKKMNVEHKEPEKETEADRKVEQDDDQNIPTGTGTDKVVTGGNNYEEKLAEMQDRYLRLSAEFDNYRKRTLKEKMEISKYAGEDLIIKILPIMDDFERALKSMDESSDCKSIKEGIDLIYSKLGEFLKQQGIKEIEAMNIPFNVDLHDAVAKLPVAEEDNKGKVVDVILKGYYLKDKVIRHAKVVVGE